MNNVHRLLKRQVAKHFGEDISKNPKLGEFLKSINEAYTNFDSDYEQLERTLEVSSNELFKSNESLNLLNNALEEKIINRTSELESANSILIQENEAKKKREAEKIFTDKLLKASNDAINKLIQSECIIAQFSQIFKSVLQIGAIDQIFLFQNNLKKGVREFSLLANTSEEKETGSELLTRLDFVLKNNFEKIVDLLLNNEPVFLRDLEKKAGTDGDVRYQGAYRNLICPVVIKGRVQNIVVFNSEKGRNWTAMEKTIFSRLVDSMGSLLNRKELEQNIINQRKAILEAQKFSNIGTFEINFIELSCHFTDQAAKLLNVEMKDLSFDSDLIKRLRKNVYKQDLSIIDEAWANAVKSKSDVRLDFRVVHENNRIVHLNWNLKTVFSKSGKPIIVRGTLQDISERIAIQAKAKTAEIIIENSPSILFRWRVADNWPVEYVTTNVIQLGYTQNDFLEHKVNYAELIHPEDYPRILDEIKEHKKKGNSTYQQVYRIIKANGEILWVEDQTLTEVDAKGNDIFHQGIITDVTDKMNARLALEKSETRFRSLVQNSTDVITILNSEGGILYESPAFFRLFGYNESEIGGKTVFDYVHPEDIEIVKHAFKSILLKKNSTAVLTFRFKTKQNKYIYLEAVGNNLLHEEGINGIVINSRDVSERFENEQQLKEYAQSLEKINKELDQFAYIVSHDLKAPLRAINNLAEWISEDLQEIMDEGTKKNISLLRGRIGRMEALINGILNYSRAGRMKAENIEIPMNTFLEDIVFNLSPPEHFVIQIQEGLPIIEAEKVSIEQVFSNFISNAIKYNANENPVVKIGYEDKDSMHCFFVEDNGPGISKDFHEKVFAIFQTLQARDSVESTGVGLAIVKKIVEEKGGNVWLESEEGKGAKFLFTFPKHEVKM